MENLYFWIIIIAILIIFIYFNLSENFASCGEKAREVHKWFKSNNDPSYVDYKSSIDTANVVEYQDLMNKYRSNGGSISLPDVSKTLGCPQ